MQKLQHLRSERKITQKSPNLTKSQGAAMLTEPISHSERLDREFVRRSSGHNQCMVEGLWD